MSTNRRDFIKSSVSASLAASWVPLAGGGLGGGSAAPPNILLFFPDQWRFDWMSGWSELDLRTPSLDRLTASGARFDQAVVACPLCAPSRACLASGRSYDRAGVPNNDIDFPSQGPTIYRALRSAGFNTMACGKMDLAKGASWWGVDGQWKTGNWGFTSAVNNAGKLDQITGLSFNQNKPADPYTEFLRSQKLLTQHVKDYKNRSKDSYGATYPTPLPDYAYCDNWITQNAIQLLRSAPAGKPWFLQVNWAGPHAPVDITSRMEETVRSRRMPSVNGSNEFSTKQNDFTRQNYTAMCENIDRGIGEILNALEKSGQLASTLVIFSSDHGDMLGDHGRWGKTVPYNPSASVPLIVAGPGVQSNQRPLALVSSLDLTATVLDYAGVHDFQHEGISLRPLLEARAAHKRTIAFSGLNGWRMATDGRYKVITGFDESRKRQVRDNRFAPKTELLSPLVFDLQSDPGENRNLGSAMPPQATALLNLLQNDKGDNEKSAGI